MTIYKVFFFTFGYLKKKDLSKKIGQRVIELRMKKGWNQADLGRALGKDRQAVEKIENGKVNATIYTLYEIAKVLEISLTTLLDIK